MLVLRIFLFGGMVAHKLVWEILKVQSPVQITVQNPRGFGIKNLVKLGKIVVLILLVIQTLFLNVFPITTEPNLIRLIGMVFFILGLSVAITGRVYLGKNWANLEDYQVLAGQLLVNKGIYRYIRHPIYLGDVLLILGLELALNSWLVIGVIVLLLIVIRQALAEEVILSNSLPGYIEYRRLTKMFIPFVV